MRGSATFDRTGRYRYRLARRWGAGPCIAFVMLNPSAADAAKDDPTVRRCLGFARRWGFGALEVVNLFAYRAADPRELARERNPVGPENDRSVARALRRARLIVLAWGASRLARRRAGAVIALVGDRPAYCLGRTKTGMPRHPLYLRASIRPTRFRGG